MSQQIVGQVGPLGPVGSGSSATPIRQGNYGDVVVSELNGRYYEHAIRGNVFMAAQVTPLAAIALAAGSTTLVLFNPNNSQKNLVLLDVVVTLEAETNATQQVAIQLGGAATGATQTQTTPLATHSALVGSTLASTGIALVASTFSNTAVAIRYLGAFGQSANATAVGTPTVTSIKDEIAGAIIIPPGSYVGIYALTGGTIGDVTLGSSMTWAEVSSVVL